MNASQITTLYQNSIDLVAAVNQPALLDDAKVMGIVDQIMALPYDRARKGSASHSWMPYRASSMPSFNMAAHINTAYHFVRRVLSADGTLPVLLYDGIHEEPYAWADDQSPLLPLESERRDLEALKAQALSQAQNFAMPKSLLARLKLTPLYQSCPKEVQALLEATLPLPGVFAFANSPTMVDRNAKRFAWENYLAFLHQLRAICKRMELRKTLYDRNVKMPAARFDALKRLLASLFDAHSRLLVVRVDLKYQPQYVGDMDFLTHQRHVQEVCETAQMGKGIFKGCLGYALRMEDAPDTGLHCHVVFFFHGGLRSRDLHIAKQICNWWNDSVTLGKGLAWNVNQHWRAQVASISPDDCVLGMVDRRDEERVLKMVSVMRYLCHPGQDILYKPSKTSKTFLVKECS